jgi:alkylation response protein AidB-like acyl-CoA dehydrogenase
MDLTPTDEQAALVEELHRIAERQIRPSARACEEAGAVSEPIHRALLELGVGVPVPEEFGGQGLLDAVTGVLVAEELAWGDPGIAYGVLSSGAAAAVIELVGTEAQKAELLPGLAAGTAAGALAMAERDAGLDIFRLETTTGRLDGTSRLSGMKYSVAGGASAEVLLVVAEGPTVWRVARDEAEVLAEDNLGLRSAATARVRLRGTPAIDQIGADQTRGTSGRDPAVVRALLGAKLLGAGIAVGLARAAVEYAAAYARERTAFGKPIGAFQGVSFMIAERAIDVDAARLLVWEAAAALDAGSEDAVRLAMAAGGQAVSAAVRASDDAVQVLGGHGYMRDHPVELWYRDAMTLATLEAPWLVGDLFLAGAHRAAEPSGADPSPGGAGA